MWFKYALFGVLLALVGCATNNSSEANSAGQTAPCLVCKYNRDLGCLNVKVTDSTPQLDHEGQTYFFCSQDCREEFLKHASKYLPGK